MANSESSSDPISNISSLESVNGSQADQTESTPQLQSVQMVPGVQVVQSQSNIEEQMKAMMEMVNSLAKTVNQLITLNNTDNNTTVSVGHSVRSVTESLSNNTDTNSNLSSNVTNTSKFMTSVYKRVENWPTYKGLSDTTHPVVFINNIEQCFANVNLSDQEKPAIFRNKLLGEAFTWVNGVSSNASYTELKKKFLEKFWSIHIQQTTYMKFLSTPYVQSNGQTPSEFAEYWYSKLQFSDFTRNTYAFLLTLRAKYQTQIQALLVGEFMLSYDKFRERLQEAELIYPSTYTRFPPQLNQKRGNVNMIMPEQEYTRKMGIKTSDEMSGVPIVEGNRIRRNYNNRKNFNDQTNSNNQDSNNFGNFNYDNNGYRNNRFGNRGPNNNRTPSRNNNNHYINNGQNSTNNGQNSTSGPINATNTSNQTSNSPNNTTQPEANTLN